MEERACVFCGLSSSPIQAHVLSVPHDSLFTSEPYRTNVYKCQREREAILGGVGAAHLKSIIQPDSQMWHGYERA